MDAFTKWRAVKATYPVAIAEVIACAKEAQAIISGRTSGQKARYFEAEINGHRVTVSDGSVVVWAPGHYPVHEGPNPGHWPQSLNVYEGALCALESVKVGMFVSYWEAKQDR